MHKFKKDCLVYTFKRPNGQVKSISIFHRPSDLSVDKSFTVGQSNSSYCSDALDELFNKLKLKVEHYENIKEFLQGQRSKGNTNG